MFEKMANISNENLILHHIGSRGGSRSFPTNINFESEMVNILYEADEECIEQIKTVYEASLSSFMIYPYCISDKIEEVDFNICYDPNLSSFLNPNNLQYDYYYFNGLYDYSFREASKVIKKKKLYTVTLDEIYLKNKDKFFLPDFISLDTQGSELRIVNGSPICIKNSLAAILEVSFIEFYENQPCFDEIIKDMQSKGYEFIRFTNSVEQITSKYPIGLRSKGRFVDGDCLFIRPLNTLENIGRKEISSYYKLAYIYISFEMLEPALDCMIEIEKNWGLSNKKNFYKFLNEIYKLSKNYKIYPKKFSDFFSEEISLSRFDNKPRENKLKSALKTIKLLKQTVKICKIFYTKFQQILLGAFYLIMNISIFKKNKLERLLEKNDFNSLSKIVYHNRVSFYYGKGKLYKFKKDIKNLK